VCACAEVAGSLLIRALEIKPYSGLTEEDAHRDGFGGLQELDSVLRDIYGEVEPHELVSIYTFHFIPAPSSSSPCCSVVKSGTHSLAEHAGTTDTRKTTKTTERHQFVKGLLSLKDLCLYAIMATMRQSLFRLDQMDTVPFFASHSSFSSVPFPIAQSLLSTAITHKLLTDDNVLFFLYPELQQLSLAGGENLTSKTLDHIVSLPCLNLTHLSLSRCVNMTANDLVKFFQALSGLLPFLSPVVTKNVRGNIEIGNHHREINGMRPFFDKPRPLALISCNG